ncbi:ABC transporter ATP-binding protein [Cohaesibacter sp. CAU 1516]|uniref:ABC transporter ATP-binding protein n=1 Tax=Cohaesibacter sp. CAU 1516 TaxID=2576038 RepID=UPI0010FCDDE8|nr:ABC transporter ATP-binding protein [Cohaesibacter sp. CAU 1516]TLP44230.1 ABC transporter ATP-binding protein [Cohaesibacter sp. CAU 1516]
MITLENVSKSYNDGQPNEVRAVQSVSLSLPLNQTTVFKGPSGSGKTTLLSVIGCLARPTSGRVHLKGELISGLPEKFMTDIRRQTFGFIFQRFNLIRGMTALENVMAPALPLGLDHGALKRKAMDLLTQLRLDHRASAPSELLSGGEAQRVAIARALINDPAILIADEPTANLDTTLTADFLATMDTLRQAGKTLLMTSHDPRIWQAPLVDRIVSMEDGAVVEIELGTKTGHAPS